MNNEEKTAAQSADELSQLRNRVAALEDDLSEALKEKNTMREKETKFQRMVENISDVIFEVDSLGVILYFSPAGKYIWGYDEDDIVGKNFMELVYPDDQESLIKRFVELGTGVEKPLVYRLKNKADEFKWVRTKTKPRIENGVFLGAIGTLIDITDQKQAEDTLRDRESQYWLLADHMRDAIWLMDLNLKTTYRSPSTYRQRGYTREEFQELPLNENLTKASLEVALAAFSEEMPKVLADPTYTAVRTLELEFYCKDGTTILAESTFSLIRDESGKPQYFLCEGRDITERKKVEESLQESSARLTRAEKTAKMGNWKLMLNTKEFIGSLGAQAIYGAEGGILSFDDARKCTLPEYIDILNKGLTDLITKDIPYNLEIKICRPTDGKIIDVHSIAEYDKENNIVYGVIQDITERKKAEEEVRESRTKLQAVFDTVGAGILIIDKDTQIIVEANRTALEMTGLPKESIIGQVCHSLVCPAQAGKCPIKDLGQNVDHSERKLLCAEGHQKDILKTVYPITIKGKECYVESFIDISDRLLANEELRKSERQMADIIEFLPDATLAINKEKRIIIWNKAIEEMTGVPAAEMIGKGDYTYSIPFYGEARPQLMDLVFEDNEEVAAKYPKINRDGDTLMVEVFCHALYNNKGAWVLAKASPLHDQSGNIIGAIESLRDITERKKADHDLKVSETNLRMILDSVDDAIFIYTKEGKIIDVNSKMLKMYSVNREEVFSMSIEKDFSTPDNPLDELPGIWESVMNGAEVLFEWKAQRPHDSSSFNVEVFLRKINLNNDDFILAAVRDITDRKQAEEEKAKLESQLQQSQKMEAIGTLAGGIAHDFNNILAAIIGYTEMAVEQDGNKIQKQYLQETLKGTERAKNLVRQILTFSRQDSNEKIPLDIKFLLKEAIKFLRSSIPTTVEIKQNITKEDCNIMADPTQMHQIIMNFCTNAAHAMKRTGGILKIELTTLELAAGTLQSHPDLQPGSYVKLTFHDTGHGIDPDNIQKIFDPFFTTKSVDEGTGLGLSVVYGIVKSHGGVINVDSKIDEGSTFNVYLPRVIQTETKEVNTDNPIIGGTERILFVDDEPSLVDIGTRNLTSIGYDVTGVLSSVEALNMVSNEPQRFDLVITDMTLPKMTGIILARKILKICPDIPIILCSGIRESGTEEQAKSLGIKAYIMKPLTKGKLARVIRDTLDDHEKSI